MSQLNENMWMPPEPDVERRWVTSAMQSLKREIRLQDGGTAVVQTLDGYAYTYQLYVIKSWFGDFEERIAEGAATKTLKEKADVRSLLNHDPNLVLGRTKAGTLELAEEKDGLRSITIPNMEISHAADTVRMVERGDIDQMSFAFRVVKEQWTFLDDDAEGLDQREIQELELFDTSPVTFPANPFTSISIGERSMKRVARIAAEGSKRAQRLLDRWTQRFDIQPGKPGQEIHSNEPDSIHSNEPEPSHSPDEKRDDHSVELMKLRLAIARRRTL